MNIPGLNAFTREEKFGTYLSAPLKVKVLDAQECQIIVDGYDEDSKKEEFQIAILNFLSINKSVLKEAQSSIYQYYSDCNSYWDSDEDEYIAINSADEIWQHIQFGNQPVVARRAYGDKGIYVSVECACNWEEEHGLQIVFKNGLHINKIGPYDGHFTNADAYGDDSLENVIYHADE